MYQFHLYKDKSHQWRWTLVSEGNHRVIADSAESYHNRLDCLHGAKLVMAHAATATILERSESPTTGTAELKQVEQPDLT